MSTELTKNLITFIADDYKFILHRDTLNKHQNNIFIKIINKTKHDPYIIYDETTNTMYVDRDPISFSYIVDCIRGYGCQIDNIQDINLRYKVLHDFKYFGLLKEACSKNVEKHIIFEGEENNADDVAEILKSSNEQYNESETPYLNKFMNLLNTVSKKSVIEPQTSEPQTSEPITRALESESLVDSIKGSENINDFIKNINDKIQEGGAGALDIINKLSTNENIKKLIELQNYLAESQHDSDAESLELNSDELFEPIDNEASDLVNDISNKQIDKTTPIVLESVIGNSRVKSRFIPIN